MLIPRFVMPAAGEAGLISLGAFTISSRSAPRHCLRRAGNRTIRPIELPPQNFLVSAAALFILYLYRSTEAGKRMTGTSTQHDAKILGQNGFRFGPIAVLASAVHWRRLYASRFIVAETRVRRHHSTALRGASTKSTECCPTGCEVGSLRQLKTTRFFLLLEREQRSGPFRRRPRRPEAGFCRQPELPEPGSFLLRQCVEAIPPCVWVGNC